MRFRAIAAALAAVLAVTPAKGDALAPVPPPPPGPAAGAFMVHAIDVGTGLAIFVEGRDFALLYDAGSRDDRAGGSSNRVLAYLRAVRPGLRTIDHLILSHPHQDHVELMDDLLAGYRVRHVWDSGAQAGDSCGYRAFLEAVAAEPGVVYHNDLGGAGPHVASFTAGRCDGRDRPAGTVSVPRGSRIAEGAAVPLGAGARMTILYANGMASTGSLNDASVVLRLDLGRRRVLLAGDAEGGERDSPGDMPSPGSIEGRLLACCAAALRADILVVGHHGSKTSSRPAFLDAVGAGHFVLSSGPFPYSGVLLPDPEIVAELRRRGSLWRTDDDDRACRADRDKIGRDGPQPAGCDNVLIAIDAAGAVRPSYYRAAD
jgi:beta-lactamase superfamily II metal-dependent hydrolase